MTYVTVETTLLNMFKEAEQGNKTSILISVGYLNDCLPKNKEGKKESRKPMCFDILWKHCSLDKDQVTRDSSYPTESNSSFAVIYKLPRK